MMTQGQIMTIFQEGMLLAMKLAAPILVASIAIGLVIAIFQAATQIHEQTLTFVPKIVGMFLCLMLLGDWMLNNMTTYMTDLWQNFSLYIR